MKIVAIGGVAGGMSMASRAKRIDPNAEVIVLEARGYVSFSNCGMPYMIGGISEREDLLSRPPEYFAAKGIDARIHSRVTSIDPERKVVSVVTADDPEGYELGYDKLVIATGSRALIPPIAGAEYGFALRSIEDMDRIATEVDEILRAVSTPKAVVIGAGPVGVEMAENLTHRGFGVTLVSRPAHILKSIDGELADLVQARIEAHSVTVMTGQGAQAIEKVSDTPELRVLLADGTELEANLVIHAAGARPRSELGEQIGLELAPDGSIITDGYGRTSNPDVYASGDVAAVEYLDGSKRSAALAGLANRGGRRVADAIFLDAIAAGESSVEPPFSIDPKPALGTEIVQAFDWAAAQTGIPAAELDARDDVLRVRIDTTTHAGYYPGSQPLHVVAWFDRADDRLLGASVVGADSVDKQINVLAAALHAQMDAEDLAELELAYAPQFGHTKDSINLLGYVATNELH